MWLLQNGSGSSGFYWKISSSKKKRLAGLLWRSRRGALPNRPEMKSFSKRSARLVMFPCSRSSRLALLACNHVPGVIGQTISACIHKGYLVALREWLRLSSNLMRTRCSASSRNALREVTRESTSCVGFINPGSLMDQLPIKGSTQQTTLRTTRNSWAGPNT